jgi:hypothetical protein
MKKVLAAVGAFGLLLLAYVAWAQPLVQNTFSGNECWNAGQGPGGPSTGFVCTAQMRNGQGLILFSGSGSFTTTATIANATYYWVGTAPTTWTITLPANAFDGEIVEIGTNTTLTTMVTVSANTGQTLDGTFNNQTISANTSVEFRYNLSGTKWYRLR